MNVTAFLIDSCVIEKRTVDDSGKTSRETFSGGCAVPCRMLTRTITSSSARASVKGMQNNTDFRVTFALRKGEDVSQYDRILCRNRRYRVLEVTICQNLRGETHRTAVCEAVE